MLDQFYKFFTITPLCLAAVGCTKVPPANDTCVNAIVGDLINKKVQWVQDDEEAEQVKCCVQNLLANDLTLDSAIQIAFLNNPEIQAVFEEIGIARADLIQAGLLSNPLIDGFIRFPIQNGASTNVELSAIQNFLDIFLIPLRQKVAAAQFEQIQLKVANAILNLAFEVEETFYSLQSEQTKLNLMQPLVEAVKAASQLADAQKQQGNINDLEFQERLNEFLQANVELAKTRLEIVRLREKMNRLLGRYSHETCWAINSPLPQIPEQELPPCYLEEIALSQRLDLQSIRWETEKLARMLGIKQWWAYTAAFSGIGYERDPEGFKVLGPAFAFELPIFNYGQADRARLHAMLRQSIDRFYAKKVEILSDVRSARDRMMINRALVMEYQKQILPLQAQIVSLSQRYYNYMALSLYKLLHMKKQELQMQINYNLVLRDYWISRVELDRALGGSYNDA